MAKIPSQAKRVFKGVIFDVYQWSQKMFDGSVATFEKLKRPDTVEVIAAVENKILILEQEQPNHAPFVSLPGGRVDGGEKPLAAAKRELLEESGYVSNNWKKWDSFSPYDKIVWQIHWFVARDCKLKHKPRPDVGEKISTRLISFEEFIGLSDQKKFWGEALVAKLLRLRLDSKEMKKFKNLLFG